MALDRLMGDDIFIESPTGEQIGPVKASVQGNRVFVSDVSISIEEGGKILRPLPNGKAESHLILQVDFHKDPHGGRLSHYEIRTRKESSLAPAPSATTINITHSQGIQIGDNNIQNIMASIDLLAKAIDSADASPAQKSDAKQKLKTFLAHPLTAAILGAAAARVLATL